MDDFVFQRLNKIHYFLTNTTQVTREHREPHQTKLKETKYCINDNTKNRELNQLPPKPTSPSNHL